MTSLKTAQKKVDNFVIKYFEDLSHIYNIINKMVMITNDQGDTYTPIVVMIATNQLVSV